MKVIQEKTNKKLINNNNHPIKTIIGNINVSNGFNIEASESTKTLIPYKKQAFIRG